MKGKHNSQDLHFECGGLQLTSTGLRCQLYHFLYNAFFIYSWSFDHVGEACYTFCLHVYNTPTS